MDKLTALSHLSTAMSYAMDATPDLAKVSVEVSDIHERGLLDWKTLRVEFCSPF